jgi:ribosomal protein S18 acetylase RimI-like enzyme
MPATDVRVVPISEEHVEGYNAFLGVVAHERRYIDLIDRSPLEWSRRFVMSTLEKEAPLYGAIHGDVIVGWCDVGLSDRSSFTHRGHLGMGVHPDYRGQGIGSRLLRSALARARETGLECVDLDVYASNVRAVRLYEQFGFEVEGWKKRGRKLDGVYDDIIEMALFFDQSSDSNQEN